jgi:hypothetical protein
VSKIYLSFYTRVVNAFVQSLDFFRVSFLRFSLKPRLLRSLYTKTHTRLAFGFLVSILFYLPIAFLWPQWLLSFGPLIFGYPHLISSYRFTPEFRNYGLLILMTALAVALHVFKVGSPLPFGVWQIVVATLTLLIVQRMNPLRALLAISICGVLVKLAWIEPLIFVGASLLLHNWVAFFYWIKVSKEKARKNIAILAMMIFLVINLVILGGFLDSWIPATDGVITFAGPSENTAWMLASWSSDAHVWYRFLVLYVFGLSIHYFIWLRAIPESKKTTEHPSSYRLIAQNLKISLGQRALIFTLCLCGVGIIFWVFSMPMGAQVYFEVAILHGSLELMFLLKPSAS